MMEKLACCVFIVCVGCGRIGFDGGDNTADPPADDPNQIANLVAHWTFEDLTTAGSVDLVGGRVASCTGGQCPTTTAGADGLAAAFDGADDCLLVPSLDSFAGTMFTVSAWVSVAGSVTGPLVVHENYGGCPSPEMSLTKSSLNITQLNTADGHNESWTLATMTPSWHHLVVRWDGSQQRLFVDGRCCNATPTIAPRADATAAFSIGCYPANSANFAGAIDDLRIYDRPLTSEEVATLYAVGGRTAPTAQACTETCLLTSP